MKRHLLFVGGIHGSGKTTLCAATAPSVGAQHLSSGELISRARALDLKDKSVADVEANQSALVLAVNGIASRRIILDGHFCLITREGLLARVPVVTFEALEPSGLALVTINPEVASRRLRERDGRSIEATVLRELQDEESAYAEGLSKHLGVPLSVLDTALELEMFARGVFSP